MGLIDTEVFPRTNLYDINIYIDDEDYLYINAYKLVWVDEGKVDSEGNPIYTFANDDYEDSLCLVGVDLHSEEDLARWGFTRHQVNSLDDFWSTTSEIENDVRGTLPDELLTTLMEQIEKYCVAYEADVQKSPY